MSSKKVRPSIWMASWMLAWAAVSACTGAVQNHTQLYVVRTLLGITEVSSLTAHWERNTADYKAPFYPGAIYLLSLFYTRKEIALRIGVLYSANILATSFSGLIAAATFATIGGAQGLEGWRWLFIILGKSAIARSEQGLIYRNRYGCRGYRRYLPTPRSPSYHTLAHARSASARP